MQNNLRKMDRLWKVSVRIFTLREKAGARIETLCGNCESDVLLTCSDRHVLFPAPDFKLIFAYKVGFEVWYSSRSKVSR